MTPMIGLLALVSCASVEPVAEAAPMLAAKEDPIQDHPTPVVTWDGLTIEELPHVDVRGTARSTQVILDIVRSQPADQRQAAADSLKVLQVTCPYNRASVQLPIALHLTVQKTEAGHLDPLIQKDWEYLQQGLADHVAILDALGADLPAITEEDYLYGKLFPDGPMTRAELEAKADPVGATMPLLSSIRFVVDDYPAPVKESIDAHFARVDAGTGLQWNLKRQIIGWRAALQKMEPFLQDEARKKQVAQMIYAMDEYIGLYC